MAEFQKLSDYETIVVRNPLEEDVSVRFNGELFKIPKGASKSYPIFLAIHIAKHISDKALGADVLKVKKAKTENPYRPENAQLMIHDNPKRRISLYDVLNDKILVQYAIDSFYFKGFIGEMKEYDDYVEKKIKKTDKAEKSEKLEPSTVA